MVFLKRTCYLLFIFMLLRYWIFIFFIPILLFGQQEKKIDSLHELYSKVQNKDLIRELKYAEQAVILSEASVGEDTLKLISYNNYINTLYKLRKIELAEKINEKMKNLAQNQNNRRFLNLYYYHSSCLLYTSPSPRDRG